MAAGNSVLAPERTLVTTRVFDAPREAVYKAWTDPKRLALVMAMVSKRYRADLPTIVKANVPVNFLLSDLTAFDPLAPTIFLYLGLSDFVLATLRNERHRLWLRRLTSQLSAYLGDCSQMSDAERTAALWLAQMHAFSTVITTSLKPCRESASRLFCANDSALVPAASLCAASVRRPPSGCA